jgi:hypothetical protein
MLREPAELGREPPAHAVLGPGAHPSLHLGDATARCA